MTRHMADKKTIRKKSAAEATPVKEKKSNAGRPKLIKFVRNKVQNQFLNYYIQYGIIKTAFEKLEMNRTNLYLWKKDDCFRIAFEKAERMAGDVVMDEIVRRGVHGFDETTIKRTNKGIVTTVTHKFSDQCLQLLARRHFPDMFKERVELQHQV